MQNKTYWVELQPLGKEAAKNKRAERVLRSFLFNKCNIIRFKIVKWTEGLLLPRKRGGEKDPNFIKFAKTLKPHFIKREFQQHNTLWWDDSAIYYFYKLSSKIKTLLNKRGLFYFDMGAHYFKTAAPDFYCMANPTFYNGKEKIAEIISDEWGALLYLTEVEKTTLKRQGLNLHEISNQ